ncbi:MAG: cytochrome c3 family protein [Byssovorax sp.]
MSDPAPSGEGESRAPASTPGKPGPDASGGAKRPSGRRSSLAASLVVLVAALLALVTAQRARYVEADPTFCAAACHHPKDAQGEIHKGHNDVACQKCHAASIVDELKLYGQSIIGSSHPRKHGQVDAETCARCHETEAAKWAMVAQTQGHRDHRGVKDVTCNSCHSPEKQAGRPIEKLCADCHKEERLHKASTENAETCISCHSFAASEKRAGKPTTIACTGCHADGTLTMPTAEGGTRPMKAVNEHALHGDLACQLCHNAHGKTPHVPEGQPVCRRCHQLEIFAVGKQTKEGPEGHKRCEQCHKPHAPLKTALESCHECHENKTTPASADAPSTALRHRSCASCHLPHSWRAEKSGCPTCHEDKAQMIATRSPPEHGSCTNCHEVHGPPPTGLVCVKCHEKTKGNHLALAPSKHKDCTSCHNPHAPSPKETRTACAKCHLTELSQLVQHGPEAHARGDACLTCHKPHDNPLPAPGVCSTCHTDKSVMVSMAAPDKHKQCASCHEPHAFAVRDMVSTCSRCHGAGGASAGASGAAVLDFANGPHKGECKSCHIPHGTPAIASSDCFRCHTNVEAGFKPPNKQHATCRSCHQPHQPAKRAQARCGTCHSNPMTTAAAWPAGSPHAGACAACHTPHDVKTKKACGDCHGKEATSAEGGKHQCVQCHPPHGAPPGKGAAWWSRCNACHANKVESVKALGPKHSDCKNCHEPHRFGAPACTQCHSDMEGKGLHASRSHKAMCTGCHDPHQKGAATRNQCLACHSDRKQHQPDADKCYGCHVFR